jgi:hypothetical protein
MLKSPLLVTLATALLLAACTQGTVTSARFVDSPSGVQLEYTLKAAHAYLAEYHRTLHVVFAHNQIDFPLEMDTGGYLLMNIHRLPDHRLLLFDGLAHIIIDPQGKTVEEVSAPANASAAEYVGCFDWPQGGAFGFIPAGDRPEKKPHVNSAQ